MNSRRICHCCVALPREAHCTVCDGPAEDTRLDHSAAETLKQAAEFLGNIDKRRTERADRLGLSGDVRAVVEEPVAEIDPDARHLSVLALHDVMQAVSCSSLYSLAEAVFDAGYCKSNPQRPVVLPERMVVPATRSIQGPMHIAYDVAAGYNACLDAVERLNK